MTASLVGISAKFNRAEYHFAQLDASIKVWSGTEQEKHTPIFDPHPDRKRLDIRIQKPRPVNPDWALMIGDIVHNLRSTLDHMVCQLIVANGHSPATCNESGIAFPICDTSKRFTESAGKIKRLLHGDAFTLIKGLQPYQATDSGGIPAKNTLWVLSQLDIIDKHRVLIVAAKYFRAKNITFRINEGDPVILTQNDTWRPLEDGAAIGSVDLSTLSLKDKDKMHVNAETEVQILFKETGLVCDGLSVQKTMRACMQRVYDVVYLFRRFFPK